MTIGDLMNSIPSAPAWHANGLCRETDPETFFPERGGINTEAKKTCEKCDVLETCREWALDTEERWGIWGGMSERERRAEIARRRAETGEPAA